MANPTRKLDPGYNAWTPFWFLAPAVAALLAIGIYPTLFAIVTSFREYQLTRPRSGFPFIGLENYQTLLFDSTVRDSLLLTGGGRVRHVRRSSTSCFTQIQPVPSGIPRKGHVWA